MCTQIVTVNSQEFKLLNENFFFSIKAHTKFTEKEEEKTTEQKQNIV